MTVEEIFRTPIFLAPMAGVTDTAFRVLVRELIDDDFARKNLLMFSEMVSAAGVHYRNEKTLEMLKTVEAERPTAIQIFGSDPKFCAEAAAASNNSARLPSLILIAVVPRQKFSRTAKAPH